MKPALIAALAVALLFNISAAEIAPKSEKSLTPPHEKNTLAKNRKARKRKNVADEEAALQNALKKLFNPDNYAISGLSLKEGQGEKTLSGSVSFFGNEGVNLSCVLSSDNKIKSISGTFPASATFRINHLDKLSQGSFRSLLPFSLSASEGISIKDFSIQFDASGTGIESFTTNLAAANWDFLDFEQFKMNALTLRLDLLKGQKAGGELTGEVSIGSVKTRLSATMSAEKPIAFTGAIPGGQGTINIKQAMYTIAGKEETDRFFGLIPGDIFNALTMPSLTLTAIPGDKKISLASLSDIGNVEMSIQKRGAQKDIRLILQPKDLGKVLQTDIFKDIQLVNPLVLVSSTKDRDVIVPSQSENIAVDVEEGMNVVTAINLGEDIKKLFALEKINLSGSIDKDKRVKLAAKQEMDLALGDGGVKFTGVNFGLQSTPAPKFFMDGTISIPINNQQFLKFNAGLSTAPIPPQFGGSLTLITDGGDGIWRNPMGVPGVGIKNLHGAMMIMPVPPFLSEIELAGDIMLGKNLTPQGNPIQGALNMRLNVVNPLDSYFEASVKNLTVAGMINAFSDAQLTGEIANLLRSGIDNAKISVHPKNAEVSASGEFSLLGKSAQIAFAVTQTNFTASGSMDPWEIKSGDFTVFAVRGAGGNPRPAFSLQVGTDPSFSLNGAVTALETMRGSANINITKNGFIADLSGDIFNGKFSGNLHAYGRNLSTNPVIHAELNLSQTVVNDFKVSLKNFIVAQAKNSEKDIKAVRDKVNTGAKFLDDTFKGSLNAVNTLQKGTATAGILIVDNLVPDVTNISFVGDLNAVSTKIQVKVDYRAAGKQMPPIQITMDLKNPNYNEELDKMAEAMGKEVLNVFSGLGDQVANLGVQGKELLTDLGKGVIVVGTEVGKVANDAVGEIDRFWNGDKFEPVKSGPELEERSKDTRHYIVTIKQVVAIKAEDDPIQEQVAQVGTGIVKGVGEATSAVIGAFGANQQAQNDVKSSTTITFKPDPLIEIYGAILVATDRTMRVGDPAMTNANAWSRDRVYAEANVSVGRSFPVNNSKHFYAQNGTNHSITIRSKLKEYDEGEHYSSDGEFSGVVTIPNLGQWDWARGHRVDDSFTATVVDSEKESIVRIDYTIELEPQISLQQLREAIAGRNIDQVGRLIKKGGDITQGSVLEPAIQNKDVSMINFLLASGAIMQPQDLAAALQPASFSEEIATKLMVRSNVASTAADLDLAISLNSLKVLNLMLSRGAAPSSQQLQIALNQNKLEIAEALLAHNAPAVNAHLDQTINPTNLPMAALLIKYGVQPTITQLNQAVQANNKPMVSLMLSSQKPDQNSYQLAAEKNDLELFNMISATGVVLESDLPSQKAIDFNNMELLEQTLFSGASASNALNYAVQKENMAAITLCLNHDGNPNLVSGFAARKDNTELFTQLLNTYKANGTIALNEAVAANNLALARIALELGSANPDVDLKAQADSGNEAMVKLLVEFHGNADLAMPGTISNKNVALLDFLLKHGGNSTDPAHITQAVNLESLEMAKLLVAHGADPNPGMPIAIAKNHYVLTSYLLSAGANVNGFIKGPAAAGNLQMVKILLDNGASPNEGMDSAVQASQLEIVKTLLSYGASAKGHLASPAQNGNLEMVQVLLAYGADPNDGIKQAVNANKTEVAVILLEAGASPAGLMATTAGLGNKAIAEMLLNRGIPATEGIKPAVQNNHTDVSMLLLNNEAAIDGLMPLAAGHGNGTIVEKLLTLGAVADEGTQPAVTNKHTGVVSQLIAAGANVQSSSFMVIAVNNRQEEMVRLLHANQCDVSYTDAKGNSFLHIVAGDDGEVGLVKAFIEFGISVDQVNLEGDTPLHLAAESGKDNLEVVQILVESGADVNAVNKKGETPRKSAKGRKVKKYLKDNGGARKIKK